MSSKCRSSIETAGATVSIPIIVRIIGLPGLSNHRFSKFNGVKKKDQLRLEKSKGLQWEHFPLKTFNRYSNRTSFIGVSPIRGLSIRIVIIRLYYFSDKQIKSHNVLGIRVQRKSKETAQSGIRPSSTWILKVDNFALTGFPSGVWWQTFIQE